MKSGFRYILFSVISGLMLAYSWPGTGDLEWMIFLAFLPILYVEYDISVKKVKYSAVSVFSLAYLCFFIFNIVTTWWIKLASPGGMYLAVIFNSLFLSLIFLLFHFTRKYINSKVGYVALVIYWMAFEYLHINWELSWIWLNLGNVFANKIQWIQWYEYTGALGGTFWVLTINTLLFYTAIKIVEGERFTRSFLTRISILISMMVFPVLTSKLLFNLYVEKDNPVEVVVVQPNIDPYTDKFSGMHEHDQIDRLIRLSEEKITEKTELVFGPETAFPLAYWEHEIDGIYGSRKVNELLQRHPKVKYIVGLSTIRLYGKEEKESPTARSMNDGSGNTYDYFNSVMQESLQGNRQLYRKSRLVLGVERMPFTSRFKFLEELSISLGGTSGSLGTEKEAVVFTSATSDGKIIHVIPAICYESIYGEYLTEFVKKGGNILGVVTNDGWWGNTPGYSQHLAYSRIRAIELRRSVARSANTGISALINQKGEILQESDWWTEAVLCGNLNLNDSVTFYARHGDYPGRLAAFFSILLILWLVVRILSGKTGSPQLV